MAAWADGTDAVERVEPLEPMEEPETGRSGQRRADCARFTGSGKTGSTSGSLGGWALGAQPAPCRTGLAYFCRKDADLLLSTHFHPSGKVEQEQSTVGLYFANRHRQKQFTGIQMPPVFGAL